MEDINVLEKGRALAQVMKLIGRVELSKNEQWIFNNYWNKKDFEFRKDGNGKLSIHKITR